MYILRQERPQSVNYRRDDDMSIDSNSSHLKNNWNTNLTFSTFMEFNPFIVFKCEHAPNNVFMSVSSFVVKGFNKNGFRLLRKESGALEKLLANNSHLKGIAESLERT